MLDRTYYRSMSDEYLIEAGKDSGHELCIALAERLEDTAALDAALADQQDTIDELRIEIEDLRMQLFSMRKDKDIN